MMFVLSSSDSRSNSELLKSQSLKTASKTPIKALKSQHKTELILLKKKNQLLQQVNHIKLFKQLIEYMNCSKVFLMNGKILMYFSKDLPCPKDVVISFAHNLIHSLLSRGNIPTPHI